MKPFCEVSDMSHNYVEENPSFLIEETIGCHGDDGFSIGTTGTLGLVLGTQGGVMP